MSTRHNNRTMRHVSLVWMLALMMGGGVSWAAGADEQNLVVNPGFELGQGDAVEGWQKQSGDKEGAGQGRWRRERHQALADIAHYGEFYMRGEDAWQTLVQKVPVKGGQLYEFSCCLKTDVVNDKEKGNTFLWLIYYDKDGKEIMPYDYGATEATAAWKEYSREITAPAAAAYMKILLGKRLSSSGPGNGGSVCFDNVKLKATQAKYADRATITYYKGNKLYLFNGITIPFMPNYSPSFKSAPKNLRIVFEVQEGIEIKDIKTMPPGFVKIERKELAQEDEKHVAYIAYCPGAMAGGWPALFYMTSTCKPGETRYGYLWVEWEGGKQEPQVFSIETLEMEKVIPPKRFLAGINLNGEMAVFWPDLFENYRKLGMNMINLWEFPTIYMADWQNPGAICAPREPGLKEFVARCKKEGMNISGNTSADYSGDWPVRTEEYLGSRAIDINGKMHPRYSSCLSYRGPGFEKWISSTAKLLDYGFTWIEFDDEQFAPGDDNVCFCPRCKERFKDWLTKKHPGLEYMDPGVFERNAGEHAGLHKAWWDFKSDMMADKYEILTAKIGKQYTYLNYLGHPGTTTPIYDYKKMANSMQYIMPMVYHTLSSRSPNFVGDETYLGWKLTDGKGCIAPAICAGSRYYFNNEQSRSRAAEVSHELKYVILEAAVSGGKGFVYWPGSSLDGLDWKYMADAIRIVDQVEDIVMDGSPVEKAVLVEPSLPGVRVRCVESEKGTVVLVSEYSDKVLELKVKFDPGKKAKVIDVETGSTVGRISSKKPVFSVKLDKERVRVFQIR